MVSKKRQKSLLKIAGLLAVLVLLAGCNVEKASKVCFKENCFTVELASTPQERARGLMHREHLDSDKGMLFVFEEEGVHSFWMKNMLIPLDLIWINETMDVVYLAKDVQPCKTEVCESIRPDRKAKYVLEVNAGVCDETGLAIGDKAGLVLT
jgi:uncharacterized membrane protein (UPF0127 family)